MMRLVLCLLLGMSLLGATAHAAEDGFVFSSWGHWTVEDALGAVAESDRVGARHMSLMVRLCQDGLRSSEIRWCDEDAGLPFEATELSRKLTQVVADIHRRGMSFGLLPIIYCGDGLNRGLIFPNNRAAWFASYKNRIEQIARFSQQHGATSLIVGSELTSMFLEGSQWRSIIARVRSVFSGHLTISPLFVHFSVIPFWDALDSIGVSAYFPLAANDKPFNNSQVMLNLAWKTHQKVLEAYARKHGKKLTFVEVGYPNTNVAASRPWDYEWEIRKLQYARAKRAWEAFRATWSRSDTLRSFSIWSLTNPATDAEQPMLFSPIGKPAEAVVRRLFAERRRVTLSE